MSRTRSARRRLWYWLRIPFWTGGGLFFGFLVSYTLVLDHRVQDRFEDWVFSVPTRVFARPLSLAVNKPMTSAALKLELGFAGYKHDDDGQAPGSWTRQGNIWWISSHGYPGSDGSRTPRRIRIVLGAGEVMSVRDAVTGEPMVAHLDPARIAMLYGAKQEDRRVVRLNALPPLLISGLQAVEDRSFKHNPGVDFTAMIRALMIDLRVGHPVQGASTLTQQLVRNLFLGTRKTLTRKFNEALMAMLLDLHYSKGRILEAYVNEVFLGQQGDQAVHGFAAAAMFYFGRPLRELRAQDIALLVGLLKGPSYYNPRRYPRRALARRNLVLHIFASTGLLTPAQARAAQASPLVLAHDGQLPHNRFPAFMNLVRKQIMRDFDEQTLRKDGLSIYTTLDPMAQLYTEQAIEKTMKDLGHRADGVQAAGVVTDARTGSVLALVGSRVVKDMGFNRALDARRPVGSLIKPFVYLVALTSPERWNLASLLDDSPLSLPQPGGSTWTPHNHDHQNHGKVPMIDALTYSWNLASIRLGLAVGLARIRTFLTSFGFNDLSPGPALLIGAIDLSPFQVAHMYAYLASGGYALPLLAVRSVLDSRDHLLKRYEVHSRTGHYQHAVDLVTWGMQQVAVVGTAHAIGDSPLAWLHVAGKTGTSNAMRDSWFAGFTADHLAVFWMGRDNNKPTTLSGSSGAMAAWRNLFARLPTRPLNSTPGAGLRMVWINPDDGRLTQPHCDGARQIPIMTGSLSGPVEGCFWQHVSHWLGGDSKPVSSGGPGHP